MQPQLNYLCCSLARIIISRLHSSYWMYCCVLVVSYDFGAVSRSSIGVVERDYDEPEHKTCNMAQHGTTMQNKNETRNISKLHIYCQSFQLQSVKNVNLSCKVKLWMHHRELRSDIHTGNSERNCCLNITHFTPVKLVICTLNIFCYWICISFLYLNSSK